MIAAASGNKTATAAGNADAGNAHLLALRPRSVNLSIATPTGTAANDQMIASIGFNNSSAAITPPAGWTLIRRMDNTNTTSNSLAVYRKTAAAGEPASHAWGIAGGAFLVGGIQSFSGVDTANPIDAEAGQSTASATAHDTPSITTSTANSMLVTSHTYASSQSWTPQAGLSESFDRLSGSASATGQSITGGRQAQAAAGASGTKRATAATSADRGNTHLLALRRFVPNAPPTVSLTSPANGASFPAPANMTLTASAADSDGTIQKVEFFHGGTNLIATVTSAPYTFAWSPVGVGAYTLTAVATDNQNATTTSAPVNVSVSNAAPTVSITSPAAGASFSAPANITLTASAADSDGSIQKVEFFHGGSNLIATLTAAPYSFTWTGVPQGTYTLTAVATDNLNATTTSAPVNVTVNRVAALHFVHADHLSTPREIYNGQQQLVWRWSNQEPFGDSPPDGNPSGLGAFTFPLRFEGTYADAENGILQNWRRDLDTSRGQYLQSDPIGLRAGLNTYLHLQANPLAYTDPEGLLVQLLCRPVTGLPIKSHCFVWVTCPQEGWDFTLSLFGNPPYVNSTGYKRISTSRDPTNQDNPNAPAVNYRQTVTPSPDTCNKDCAFEKSILDRFERAPSTLPYGGLTNNSNTFAQHLITSGAFGTSLPSNVPPSAPGFVPMVGGRIR